MGRNRNTRRHHSTTPATVALEAAGVDFTVRTFTHSSGVTEYGAEAAAALPDVDPARICKTLLVALDGGPRNDRLAVAVLPVTASLDLKAVAAVFHAKKATMADPAVAERSTGYVVGGISPVGQKRPLATVVDSSVQAHPTILVSGGRRGVDVELSPAALAAVLDAAVAPVIRR